MLKITVNDWRAAVGMLVLFALVLLESNVTLPVWNAIKELLA